MHDELKQQVYQANLELVAHGLVTFTWGNVSQIDRQAGVVAIKPSGVSYGELKAQDIVLLDLRGHQIEGQLKPSSDTATHLELYRSFAHIGGVCHTHSRHATLWAQACQAIPCFGTTHADHFYGPVPVTEVMTPTEIAADYEGNTGKVIVRCFQDLNHQQMPAVLVANHGPFTWGKDAAQSVVNAVVLEEVAALALGTRSLAPTQPAISQELLDKHYLRKHGRNAYYGQT